jgi:hypothetical protein
LPILAVMLPRRWLVPAYIYPVLLAVAAGVLLARGELVGAAFCTVTAVLGVWLLGLNDKAP